MSMWSSCCEIHPLGTMSTNTEFSWNLITQNIQRDEFIEKKIHEKIAEIGRRLGGFPKDSVHLHVELERSAKQDGFTARLTLRVPSNILHSEKTADDLMKALDLAVDSVLHDLEAFKATLAGSRFWRHREYFDPSHYQKSAAFALQAEAGGTGPQNDEDVVRDLFQQHYSELLHHARRDLRNDEEAGEIPQGAIDAREVVDEVRKQAVAKAGEKQRWMNWMVWFYHLIHEELKRRRYVLKNQQPPTTEQPTTQPSGEQLQTPSAQAREHEPDPLDDLVIQKDTLDSLQHDIRTWPPFERAVFELYYVEGLAPEEIAAATSHPLQTVQQNLESVRQKLRQRLHQQEATA